ncbi:AAC-rich mRNA clone AAC11 protein [Drosophila obscura]|uniref:AAC-rich mRNA clone AAC11 protein n=1 Tax=Drosophila obscura TaxID=7282 RepID=UPI001BB0E787|nr:AAC-rich mRNA clone AAC11 protein [Drosophila obscura]
MQQAAQSQVASPSPPDFDFQMPCRYFKSSFARSLSLNGAGSGAGGGSAALALSKNKKPQTNEVTQQQQQQQQQRQKQRQNKEQPIDAAVEREGELESSCCSTPPPALPARRHTSGHNNNNNNLMHFSSAAANQLLLSPLPAPMQTQRNLNHVWPMQQPQASESSQDSSSTSNIMTVRAAAPSCHSHQSQSYHNHYDLQTQQQQQPMQQQQQQHPLNVEAVILQNQVDTLHWQLKQTETNCEMYRAVMEEVARFFERYQQQLHLQQAHRNGEQIARSKSLHHVHGLGHGSIGSIGSSLQSDQRDPLLLHDEDAVSASYLRARSSTNLMLNKSMHAMNEEHNYEPIAPAGSYNAFKDFTWRRSPKKTGVCKARLSAPEVAEEKLNQEAFRLARTIRNLLHTSEQQPDLTQPRHSLASGNGSHMPHLHRLCKAKTSSVMTLLQTPSRHNSTSIMNATMDVSSPTHSAATAGKSHAEMLFLRANTMRDSRLSLRSSTDSSVHSTISSTASSTSSKIETDEDTNNNNSNTNNSNNNNNLTTTASSTAATETAISHNNKKPQPTANGGGSSSTEDESGFSSISSFHDVGLPLSSTLIGGGGIDHQRRLSVSTTDSRNSTLKSGSLNVLGLPLQQTTTLNQNQIQNTQQTNTTTQPSKTTYRNAGRYQRFSTLSNEDAAAVLWV